MSSNLIELMRLNHVLLENYEMTIGRELDNKPNGQKAKVLQQHHFKQALDNIVSLSRQLDESYTDPDGSLRDEISSMKNNDLTEFYGKLNSTLEFYQKYPAPAPFESSDIHFSDDVNFSGEEVFGKYLDLNNLHLQFTNICRKYSIDVSDYAQYLDRFDQFFYLPQELRMSKAYREYLDELWSYLVDFMSRVHPLLSIVECEQKFEQEYLELSSSGRIPSIGNDVAPTSHQALRLGMFNCASELEALGMERLKEGLMALGLKCGGTLRDRANRLWAVRGVKPDDFPANLLAKTSKKRKPADSTTESAPLDRKHDVQWKEFRVSSLCASIGDIVAATRHHAEKQQTLTMEERETEMIEEEFGLLPNVGEVGNAGEDDDDGPVYNPQNVPLGWDGKPIPYWLFKLHGLGVEYKCEICGNQSYWGRRAFDRHFQEWKHAHGMRALGIPNTKHFHDITSIDDARSLYSKIKGTVAVEEFSRDQEEEFEDTEGNILNRRTYEDLARQGLL